MKHLHFTKYAPLKKGCKVYIVAIEHEGTSYEIRIVEILFSVSVDDHFSLLTS